MSQPPRMGAVTLPAPTGGWNTRDALAQMKQDQAVNLENWWPSARSVDVRNGYTPWSSNLSGYIETLMAYSGSTTNKLFGCSSVGTIYNCTNVDTYVTTEDGSYLIAEDGVSLVISTAAATEDVTGLSNGRFQYVNFTTSAGNYLRCINAADKSRVYDGTAWHKDGDGAPYDVTGLDTSTAAQINLHKNRIWFVETGTLKAYYLPTNALGGATSTFDLSSIARKGGYLMAMATWTIDGGYGVDDLAAWITSNGEVIVYRGTDPSSATTWALVGVWSIGSPIGRRCFFKYGGDLLVITQDGVYPLSTVLQSSRTSPQTALTYDIQPTMSDAVTSAGSNFGWQLVLNPRDNQLYLNVPLVERTSQQQYVMNTITKAWAKFTGWNAGCWELYNNRVYFGAYKMVGLAWDSNADAGVSIATNGLQAFGYLGKPGQQKRATMFKPLFYTNGSPSVFGGVNVDFDTSANTSALQVKTSLYGLWDTATWDSGLWAPDLDLRKSWNGARGVGNAFAPTLNSSTNGIQLQWVNSTIVYEEGGIL